MYVSFIYEGNKEIAEREAFKYDNDNFNVQLSYIYIYCEIYENIK